MSWLGFHLQLLTALLVVYFEWPSFRTPLLVQCPPCCVSMHRSVYVPSYVSIAEWSFGSRLERFALACLQAVRYGLTLSRGCDHYRQKSRLRHDGWMMDDLGVIIQAGWMIFMATWMMAVDDEKNKKRWFGWFSAYLERSILVILASSQSPPWFFWGEYGRGSRNCHHHPTIIQDWRAHQREKHHPVIIQKYRKWSSNHHPRLKGPSARRKKKTLVVIIFVRLPVPAKWDDGEMSPIIHPKSGWWKSIIHVIFGGWMILGNHPLHHEEA